MSPGPTSRHIARITNAVPRSRTIRFARWGRIISEGIRQERERERRMIMLRARDRDRERELAAPRIDPKTCHRWFEYADVLDPYGDDPDPRRETNVGRHYFVSDPAPGRPMVSERLVRRLHPEISDRDWDELMAAADERWYATLPPSKRPIDPLILADWLSALRSASQELPVNDLLRDPGLCNQTFASTQEAFENGFSQGVALGYVSAVSARRGSPDD